LYFRVGLLFKVDLQYRTDLKTKKVVAKSVIVVMGGALVARALGCVAILFLQK